MSSATTNTEKRAVINGKSLTTLSEKPAKPRVDIGTILFPKLGDGRLICIVTPDPDKGKYYAALYARPPSDTIAFNPGLLFKGGHVKNESEALSSLLDVMQEQLRLATRRQAHVAKIIEKKGEEHWENAFAPTRYGLEWAKDPEEAKDTGKVDNGPPPAYDIAETGSGWRGYVPRILRSKESKEETPVDEKKSLNLLE